MKSHLLFFFVNYKENREVNENYINKIGFLCRMKAIFKILLAITVFLTASPGLKAQEHETLAADSIPSDSIMVYPEGINLTQGYKTLSKRDLRRAKRKSRNLQFSILGGPSYSPDFGFLLGTSTLFTFSTNKQDKELKRSVLPINMAFSLGGFTAGVRPQLFFNGDRFRIFGQFNYKYNKDNYYGVGFDTNHNTERGKQTTLFTASALQLNPYFLFRVKESDFFIGPTIDFTYDKILKPSEGILSDKSYIDAGGNSDGYSNLSSGLGIVMNYDTRDVPANAYKGIFFEMRGLFYNKFIGSDTNFYRAELDYRQYVSVGKRKVIAWTAQSKNVFGNVPITRLPLTGTPFDLRGYYMGQYRDKTSHVVVAEYRQMFNSEKDNLWGRIVRRLGWVAWGGCGFMGYDPVHINGILPNVGVGIRIEVQPRMNIRFDYGYNFVDRQPLFYFNMTEAF